MKNPLQRISSAVLLALGLSAGPAALADTVPVISNVSGTTTWFSTNEYVMSGPVYVLSNGVLNIEAGTVIKGTPGVFGVTNSAATLFVTQGGKIYANGTRTKPIIFTSVNDDLTIPDDLTAADKAQWGGVVLFGNAVLNVSVDNNGQATPVKYDIYEGLPDTVIGGQNVHRFGGTDDGDNSGVFRYVSIRHGGYNLTTDKEVNGLSLCCVGSGTIVEHVEVFANADDGYEFFGGTVNAKYLVSSFTDDEDFDIDQGYRGKGQFWFGMGRPGEQEYGGEWNGSPNSRILSNAPFARFTIYNMTLIGSSGNNINNRGLRVRDYAQPQVYNSIFTEFAGPGLRVEANTLVYLTNGTINFADNLWWDFKTNGVATTAWDGASVKANVFDPVALHNEVVNPLLTGISRTENHGLDPRPRSGSPALTSLRTPPNDGFYTPVTYKGAFEGNDLWLERWTALDEYGFLPTRTNEVAAVNITGNTTWYHTNIYLMTGPVYVLSNGVLNIEAGTVIKGTPGVFGVTNSAATLFVTRGGKIYANGTANNPIIFTSVNDDLTIPDDLTAADKAQWGGVVLFGNAVLNVSVDNNGQAAPVKYDIYEGLPDTVIGGQNVHRFGGTDDGDNSGVFRYVSIRHGGYNLTTDKEVNGLSLCCVGSGTIVEHVEVFANADDGYEFFGGTVNTKYLVSSFTDDEDFDIDQGYRGKSQFWFGMGRPGEQEYGGEWNGSPNSRILSNAPFARFTIYNMTLIGSGGNNINNRGLRVRDYAQPQVYNSIFTEFAGPGLRVEANTLVYLTNGTINFADNLWWDFKLNGVATTAWDGASVKAHVFDPVALHNEVVNPLLTGISRVNEPAFQLDPRPQAGSPALTSLRTAPNDGFYTPVTYKGAFKGKNWAADWTALGEYGHIATYNAGEEVFINAAAPAPNPVTLTITRNGANVEVTYPSQAGFSYQLLSATNLTSPVIWAHEGASQPGGGTLTNLLPASGVGKFLRVIAQ